MMAGQSSFAAQGQQAGMNSPVFAEPAKPAASPALPAAPTTTQQICSCITINPTASAHQSAPVATSSAAESFAQAAAPAAEQQTFSAPAAAQQQSFAAQSASAQSYASPAAQQSATAQRAY